jgi:archaemetzincin
MIKLKIIPLGKIPEEILTEITEELRTVFDVATETFPPVGIPKECYNPIRHQYVSPLVLNFLKEKYGGRVFGVTNEDLYTENLSFIFGQARLLGDVAIISIHRLNPIFYKKEPDNQLLKERSVKEAVHEVGHMLLGLPHCSDSNCVMSFSNTIFDVDKKSKEFCEKCRQKAGIYY